MPDQPQRSQEHGVPLFSLAALLDNLPGMAYRCRNDGPRTMEFVSDGALALTGYQAQDLVGNWKHSYSDIIHPDDRDQVQDAIRAAFQMDTSFHFQVTYRIRTATGEEKWVWEQGYGAPDPDGEVRTIDGLITVAPRQVQTVQAFEELISDRTSELTTLLEIARNVAATLELEPLLELILDEVQAAVEYHGAGVLIVQDGMLVQEAARGPLHSNSQEMLPLRYRATR